MRAQTNWDARAALNFMGGGAGSGLLITTVLIGSPPEWPIVVSLALVGAGLAAVWHELGKRTFRCTKTHGSVSLYDAMAQSCNVYFWQLAERVGMDKLGDVAREFGFGAPTGLGLNGDVPGRVPWKSWYEGAGGFRIGYKI